MLLTGASLLLAFAMYYPLIRRILRRRSTADFSKTTQLMILAVQAINGGIALLSHAWYLVVIYGIHLVLVGITTILVYRYYDLNPEVK